VVDKKQVIDGDVVMSAVKSSSAVRSVGYSDKSGCLFVEFHNGNIYKYDGVPRAEFDSLMTAESAGSYFHKNIRTSFVYEKIAPVPEPDPEVEESKGDVVFSTGGRKIELKVTVNLPSKADLKNIMDAHEMSEDQIINDILDLCREHFVAQLKAYIK